MPKVFIVNEPLRKDEATGEYVRFLPLETAGNYGDVVELTPKGNPGSNVSFVTGLIRKGLEAWCDGDFLVLVGDQALLAYAASVLGEKIARKYVLDGVRPVLRFLKWERREGGYILLTLRETESV